MLKVGKEWSLSRACSGEWWAAGPIPRSERSDPKCPFPMASPTPVCSTMTLRTTRNLWTKAGMRLQTWTNGYCGDSSPTLKFSILNPTSLLQPPVLLLTSLGLVHHAWELLFDPSLTLPSINPPSYQIAPIFPWSIFPALLLQRQSTSSVTPLSFLSGDSGKTQP